MNHCSDGPLSALKTHLRSRKRGLIGVKKPVETAVLVPLVEDEQGELSVLYTVRAHTLRRQPGEISFPGGHVDPTDASFQAAAVRETMEELGIDSSSIEVLGELDVLMGWSGLIVHPFVAKIASIQKMCPNPGEVAHVFTVPLQWFHEHDPLIYDVSVRPVPDDDFPFELIPGGRNYTWRTTTIPQIFYQCPGRVIWGLTARITHHFLELYREIDLG